MNKQIRIVTSGVYGKSPEVFFRGLVDAEVNLLIDIRHRRGMRGSLYSFANSKRLQDTLKELDISYIYAKYLAPTPEIRLLQKLSDKDTKTKKRDRLNISGTFYNAYKDEILTEKSIAALFEDLDSFIKKNKTLTFCFLCVEKSPNACHRSILAKELKERYGFAVCHV